MTWGRERHNLSMTTFPSVPNHVWHSPQSLGELWKPTFFFGGKNSDSWLFSNPQNPLHTFLVHESFTSPWSHFYLGFLFWHLWMTYPPCAQHEHLRSCFTLTHALSEGFLSLTKPKGKIYKTKSLSHYITHWQSKFSLLKLLFN